MARKKDILWYFILFQSDRLYLIVVVEKLLRPGELYLLCCFKFYMNLQIYDKNCLYFCWILRIGFKTTWRIDMLKGIMNEKVIIAIVWIDKFQLTCNSSSVRFSPNSLATRFKFLNEILPVSSSSNNLNKIILLILDAKLL